MLTSPGEFWGTGGRRVHGPTYMALVTAISIAAPLAVAAPVAFGVQFDGAWSLATTLWLVPTATFAVAIAFWSMLALYAFWLTPRGRDIEMSVEGEGWAIAAAAAMGLPLWAIFVVGKIAGWIVINVYGSITPLLLDVWLPRVGLAAAITSAAFAGLAVRGIRLAAGRDDESVGTRVLLAVILNPLYLMLLLMAM